jgi:hypothetical protein
MEMTIGDTEMPIRERIAIGELLARVQLAFDDGDPDGFCACFADDGFLETSDGSKWTREKLHDNVIASRSRPRHRHYTTNLVVRAVPGHPDRASSTAAFMYTEGATLRSTGLYKDELTFVEEGWRIARRKVLTD